MMYYPYVYQYSQVFSRQMTVHGSSSLSAEPDKASIQLEVVTENEQLSHAQQDNTFRMNEVIEALLLAGIARENIQTAAYEIHPVYDYVEGKQIFRTYQVTNSLKVIIDDIDEIGRVIDLAVKSGVNRVSNIQFTLENQEAYYQNALSDALQNAIHKAEMIAETLNIDFDPTPIKIVEQISETPRPFKTFSAAEVSSTTPIEPGQIDIQAKVEVKFRY